MHNLSHADVRRLVGNGEAVTQDNWVAVDRYLDGMLSVGRRGYQEWLNLPRVDMATGAKALQVGLEQYRAWMNKWLSMDEQLAMLSTLVLDAREAATKPEVIALGDMTHWLILAARDEGMGLQEFVRQKLGYHAKQLRNANYEILVSGNADEGPRKHRFGRPPIKRFAT